MENEGKVEVKLPVMLTIADAARAAGLTHTAVAYAVKKGQLPATRGWLITRQAMNRWLRERQVWRKRRNGR